MYDKSKIARFDTAFARCPDSEAPRLKYAEKNKLESVKGGSKKHGLICDMRR